MKWKKSNFEKKSWPNIYHRLSPRRNRNHFQVAGAGRVIVLSRLLASVATEQYQEFVLREYQEIVSKEVTDPLKFFRISRGSEKNVFLLHKFI